MSGPREGPNPLRPYYIPPSVGPPPLSGTNSSAASNLGSKPTSSFSDPRPSLGSSARDLLSDLDYSEYLSDSSPSATAVVKRLLDRALWKYSSVLLAQPFEVAKTVLQVQLDASPHGALNEDMRRRPTRYREEAYDVCLLQDFINYGADIPSRFPRTSLILTNLPISPPQLP